MTRSFRDVLDAGGPTTTQIAQPPHKVLDDLAASLQQGLVPWKMTYSVQTVATGDDRVVHVLNVSVKRLEYTLQLLTVSHAVLKLYPVTLSGFLIERSVTVADEGELFDALAAVVTSGRFKEISATLAAQA